MTEAHRAWAYASGDAALGLRAFKLSLPSSQHSSLDALLTDEVLHQGGSCFEIIQHQPLCGLPLSTLPLPVLLNMPAAQRVNAHCAVHS